jgi:hypothetical protein
MEKEFVPYDLSLRMKALGYDEPCFGFYCEGRFHLLYPNSYKDIPEDFYREVDAPTFSQAFRWFREKHNLDGETCRYNLTHSEAKILGLNKKEVPHFYIVIINGEDFPELDKMVYYASKEEAELACLKELIEIVEQKEVV